MVLRHLRYSRQNQTAQDPLLTSSIWRSARLNMPAALPMTLEFSCEDAGAPISMIYAALWKPRLTQEPPRVNIPDTVGYTTPYQFGGIISELFNRVPNIDKTIISVHCQRDDLGMSLPTPSPPYRPVPARLKVRSTVRRTRRTVRWKK